MLKSTVLPEFLSKVMLILSLLKIKDDTSNPVTWFLITEKEVKEVRDLVHHDDDMYEAICINMYNRGVWMEDDAREPWFICEAHTEEIIDETLNKFEESVKEAIA